MSKVQIKNSVVLITGVNRGIGKSLVKEALKRGASKVYAGARQTDKLKDVLALSPDRVVALELDVTNRKHIQNAAKAAGDVQLVINNAGVAGQSGIAQQYKEESARQEIDVNYFGPLHVTLAFLNVLSKKKNTAVVNIVSVAGLSSFPSFGTYSASKAAAHSLTQTLRAELKPQGISVFGVYPGPIDTDMAKGVDMEKETPDNTAIRIFDGIERGEEDIAPDKFARQFMADLKKDAKAVERSNAQSVQTQNVS